MIVLVLAAGISIIVSALCSLLESVLYSTRVITLEAAGAAGDRMALAMRGLKKRLDQPLAAILILNTVANTAGAAVAGWSAGEVWGHQYLWLFSVFFTLFILLFSEIIPKTVGAVHWRWMWRWSVWPLKGMVWFLWPLIWLTKAVTGYIQRGKKPGPLVSEAELLAAARLGAHGGQISQLEHSLIQNIILLEELTARDIMTPWTVIQTVDGSLKVGQVRAQARQWGHTRIPVYREGPEDLVGYVLKEKVCQAEGTDLELTLAQMVQPLRYVPNTLNVLALLDHFLRRREHIYLVVDEYGSIRGLVTLEDVLETLVGREIVDEKDEVDDLQELARRRGQPLTKPEEED